MCHTKLGRKAKRVFLRRLFLADAACSPCLPSPTHVYVDIWRCKQITSKRHLHRPTILNSLSAGDGRLHRIVLIFRCPRAITGISVIRLSLMWCVPPMLFFLCLRLPWDSLPCERSHRSTTLAREQRARVDSRTTQSHNERSTAPCPRLESCFPANNKLDVETYLLLHVRATITTPGLTSALALIKLSWPRTLFCEAITVPNKRRGCDCLGTHFRRH